MLCDKIIYCKALFPSNKLFYETSLQYWICGHCGVKKKNQTSVFQQINTIINWDVIATKLDKLYAKGQSNTGRPLYEGLLLFKITFLQTWYNMSDYKVEDAVNDRISFSRFVGLSLGDKSPDHSIISRVRTELTKNNAYEILLSEINNCLDKHPILVKTGALIDASMTDRIGKPRGKKGYVVNEQADEEQQQIQQQFQPQVCV